MSHNFFDFLLFNWNLPETFLLIFKKWANLIPMIGIGTYVKNPNSASLAKFQSPINIKSKKCIKINRENTENLKVNQLYSELPSKMFIVNNSEKVILCAKWVEEQKPTIRGGPLVEPYKFLSVSFRWSSLSFYEGSEHMIDNERFSMELQTTYSKHSNYTDLLSDLLIISHVYKATDIDNPYLEPLVDRLRCISQRFGCHPVPVMPIQVLAPIFPNSYYFYKGSLTDPPYNEGVSWIIFSEPLSISKRQLQEFWQLCGHDGGICKNIRPVQPINEDMMVYYYD